MQFRHNNNFRKKTINPFTAICCKGIDFLHAFVLIFTKPMRKSKYFLRLPVQRIADGVIAVEKAEGNGLSRAN